MKVLVTGADGQVGRALMSARPPGLQLCGMGRDHLDLTRPDQIRRCLDSERPGIVVNCAAYTAVDQAESDVPGAMSINRGGVAKLAAALAERGTALIHLSTDYVFDGRKSGAYRETDATAPTGVYGLSKLAGEEVIRKTLAQHVILRTSWVYGSDGGNFVRTMLRLARERDEIRVVDDQRGCPTAASHIADIVCAIAGEVEHGMADRWGTYHYCDDSAVTWYGFAERIFAVAGPNLDRVPALVPIATEDYPTAATRPANSVLDCGRLKKAFGLTPRSMNEGLARHIGQILEAAPA